MELFAIAKFIVGAVAALLGPWGVAGMVIFAVIAVAVVVWAFRTVGSIFGKALGKNKTWGEWRIEHPAAWRGLTITTNLTAAAFGAVQLARHPHLGVPLAVTVASVAWLAVQAVEFWSGYPLTPAGFWAALQTSVTKMALNLVWQSTGVLSVQRGKLLLPRYESWSVARTTDGWAYGLHCNGFIPPQGTGGVAQIMEMCASPGSENDTITANLNNVLLDTAELRGPLVAVLRMAGKMPTYAGTLVERPDGYPPGVARLTLLSRLPLERVRPYPWRPGYWAAKVRNDADAITEDARQQSRRARRLPAGKARDAAIDKAEARQTNALGIAVREFLAGGIPIGFKADGTLDRVAIDDEHIQLMGQTRTGKSTLLECVLHVLAEMPPQLVRLIVCDLKGGAHLAGYRDRADVFATNPDEATRTLAWLNDQVVQPRYDRLRADGRQKIEYPTPDEPMWLVVADEAWKFDADGMEQCAAVSREGAAGLVLLVFSTQYMRQEDGMPRTLDINLGVRLATRLPDQTASVKAMTRAGVAANCRPDLIRKSKRTRGTYCSSVGGVDPHYAKSFLTGGIDDQRERTQVARRRWGRVVPLDGCPTFNQPAPRPAAAAAPQPDPPAPAVCHQPEPDLPVWGEDDEWAFQAHLDELRALVGGNPPVAEPVTVRTINVLRDEALNTNILRRIPPDERPAARERRARAQELHAVLVAAVDNRTRATGDQPAAVV